MIRRAGLAAAILMLLSATNVFATTKTFSVFLYGYSPSNPKLALGTVVKWHSNDVHHTATSDVAGLFNASVPAGGTSTAVSFSQAGSFGYYCMVHGASLMHATVNVKMRVGPSTGGVGHTFTFTLGSAATPTGFTHQTQVSRNGGTFVSLANTTNRTETYKPTRTGTYKVRTRLVKTGTSTTTGWSPLAAFKVS
jgi:plastocyanin